MPPREIVKKEISKKTGNTRITYSDGTTEIVKAGDVNNLKTYEKKQKTPTGASNEVWYTADEAAKAGTTLGFYKPGMSNKEFQKAAYQAASPIEKAYMWGNYGDTNAGGTKNVYKDWKALPNETFDEYESRLTKMYPEGELSKLTDSEERLNAFGDGDLAARSMGLLGIMGRRKSTRDPGPRVDITASEAKLNTPLEDIRAEHLADVNIPEIPDDFWLQDKVKVAGAFGDMMRVKKYMPWQATYNPTLMDPTFYDPTRELAANSSAANTASQAIGMYAGPQAMNARLAQVQGNASKNAADILGRYNNLNVGVANQFEQANAGIMNQYAADRANQATNLFDKNTIVNQQFDSEKNMARQNLRQGYIDAVTNRANTQALNSMQDNYYVDPRSGGYVNFWHGRKSKPETPIDRSKQLSQMLNDYVNAGWTREEAIAAINKQVAG